MEECLLKGRKLDSVFSVSNVSGIPGVTFGAELSILHFFGEPASLAEKN